MTATKPLSLLQSEVISLLADYTALSDNETTYYIRYLDGNTDSSEYIAPYTIPETAGFYIVKRSIHGLTVMSTCLNANTVQSLINRKHLIKHSDPHAYSLAK